MKQTLNYEEFRALMQDAFDAGTRAEKQNAVRTDEEINLIVEQYHKNWREGNKHFTEEESNFYWSGINDGVYCLRNKIKEQTILENANFPKTFDEYFEDLKERTKKPIVGVGWQEKLK